MNVSPDQDTNPTDEVSSDVTPTRRPSAVRRRSPAFAALVLALTVVAIALSTPAGAAMVVTYGKPGSVDEPAHYIHCNNNSTNPSIWVEGVQTRASPVGGVQKVGASVTLFKWTGSNWVQVGFQTLGFNWTRVGYGKVSFGPASWSLGSHGYYKAEVKVQWVTQYDAFIGASFIVPDNAADFSASYAYPASCWA
jgi:hypothetical protein